MNVFFYFVASTHLKNMLVKLDHFLRVRGELEKKYLSCHHLVVCVIYTSTFKSGSGPEKPYKTLVK